MKLNLLIFLMAFSSITYAQNEWWKIGKNSETKSETKEVKEAEPAKEPEIMEPEISDETEELWVNDSIVEPETIVPGKINITKSSSVDKIISFKSATIPPNMGPVMDGYRIQLFFDQNRTAVDKARSTILKMDDESPTYIEYKAPNYFLMQGDYRTQLEAEKTRAGLISDFPEAIVVEDKIYLPKIEEEVVEEE